MTAEGMNRSAADELRDVLDEVGLPDLNVVEVLSTMLDVRTPGRRPQRVAFLQLHDEWTIYGGATAKGGWSVHARGRSIREAVRALLALGPDVFAASPPNDPIADLPKVVLRVLDSIAADGRLDLLGETAIRWTTVFAHDDWKTVHRAFREMAEVLDDRLGKARATTTQRRGGPKLHGRIWGRTALFETDHDPGAGALVQLAVWERGRPRQLPPWG